MSSIKIVVKIDEFIERIDELTNEVIRKNERIVVIKNKAQFVVMPIGDLKLIEAIESMREDK